jgi:ribosomal protein S18 acetylase RimI-like enzyme
MTPKIIQTSLTSDLKKHIYGVFTQHAIAATGIDGLAEDPVIFEMREGEQLIACAGVQIFWGQLHIKYLIVEKPYRNQRIGRALMEHAFEFGRMHGCTFAFLETMNFQAPDFYKKLDFVVELERPGYTKGTSFFYMKKTL